MSVKLSDIRGAFHLPRVNWRTVRHFVETTVPAAKHAETWSTLAMQWLETLDQALGERYRCITSKDLILFAPIDFDDAVSIFDLAESGLREMRELFGDLAAEQRTGPLVILLFEDDEVYSNYVSPFDPEVAFVQTAGVCFKHDYVHIAIRPARIEAMRRTVLHEVAHACLAELSLPLWLEEGITQLAEEAAAAAWERFTLDSKRATEIATYWRNHGLHEFWWGPGFTAPDGGQDNSYALAQILFRQLMSDHRRTVSEFVRRANALDAGESAARQVLGVGLADLASEFLGQGDWEPTPFDCYSFVGRGSFHLNRDEYQHAIADFDRAIQLDDHSGDAFAFRGIAKYQLHQMSEAIADLERALELDPHHLDAANTLAWILATSPDEDLRDGKRSLKLATAACERCGYTIWNCVGTLAAAHAELGDFEQAGIFAAESMQIAPESEIADCETRMRTYEEHQPWREVTKSKLAR